MKKNHSFLYLPFLLCNRKQFWSKAQVSHLPIYHRRQHSAKFNNFPTWFLPRNLEHLKYLTEPPNDALAHTAIIRICKCFIFDFFRMIPLETNFRGVENLMKVEKNFLVYINVFVAEYFSCVYLHMSLYFKWSCHWKIFTSFSSFGR